MEQERASGFYVVEAAILRGRGSRRPHFLAERLHRRRQTQPEGAERRAATASGLASGLLQQRRERLRARHQRVAQVAATQTQRLQAREGREREKEARAAEKRRQLLDSQAKACAMHVARARDVAALQAKRREDELSARRQALEDRLSASEARRRARLQVPRSRRLQPTEMSDATELSPMRHAAASSIQRWWRTLAVLAVATEWKVQTDDLTLTMVVNSLGFEDFVKRIQSQQVIHAATSVLSLLRKLLPMAITAGGDADTAADGSSRRRGRSAKKTAKSAAAQVSWKNPSRVFLSAFMIVAHTSEIMSTEGPEEEKVKSTATELLHKFEGWVEKAAKGGFQDPLPTTLELLASWTAYYAAFDAWKERDTKKIIEDLVNHWMELERLWISVKEQVDAETEWKPRIEQQQKVLLNRLNRFGEPALERLREVRRQQLPPPPTTPATAADSMDVDDGDDASRHLIISGRTAARSPSPVPSTDADILSTSPQRFPPSKFLARRHDSVVAGPSSPRRGSKAGSPSPARTESPNGMSISRPSTPTTAMSASESESEAPAVVASPQRAGPIPDLSGVASSFGSTLSNEQLAHELTLDPDFALKKPVLSPLEEQVRGIARRAFFDGVRISFEAGDLSVHVPEFIADIKKQLLSMVSDTGKISAEIKEILDLDLLQQQIRHNILNMKALLSYIITKMGQLCAPIRDPTVRSIQSRIPNSDNAAILASIFEDSLALLEDMRLDLANHRLQSLRPHLRPIATEYERKKFADAVGRGDVTLDRTRAWLSASTKEREEVARARNPERVEIPENRIRFTDVFHDAILSLVFATTETSDDALPETLSMDVARLRRFQDEAQRLTIVAALLMLTQNAAPEVRGDRGALAGLKDRLMVLLADPEGLTVDNLSEQIIDSVGSAVRARRSAVNAAVGKEVLSNADVSSSSTPGSVLTKDREDLIRTMAAKTVSARDPVFGLLRRRIMASVKAHATSGTFKREGLERSGLDTIKTELEGFSVRCATWVRFNGDVYTEWYDEILRGIVG